MFKIPWSWFLLVTIVAIAVQVLGAPTKSPHNSFETTTSTLINDDDAKMTTPVTEQVPDTSAEILENEIETEIQSLHQFDDEREKSTTMISENINSSISTETPAAITDSKSIETTSSGVTTESLDNGEKIASKESSDASTTETDLIFMKTTQVPIDTTPTNLVDNDVSETTIITRKSAKPFESDITETTAISENITNTPTTTDYTQTTPISTEEPSRTNTDSTTLISTTDDAPEITITTTISEKSSKLIRSTSNSAFGVFDTTTNTAEAPVTITKQTEAPETTIKTTTTPDVPEATTLTNFTGSEAAEMTMTTTKYATVTTAASTDIAESSESTTTTKPPLTTTTTAATDTTTKQASDETTIITTTTIGAPEIMKIITQPVTTTTSTSTSTTIDTETTITKTTATLPDITTSYMKTTLESITEPAIKSKTNAFNYYTRPTSETPPPQQPSPPPTTTTDFVSDELEAILAAVKPEFTSEPHQIVRAQSHEGRSLNIPPRIHRLLNADGVEVLSGYSIVQLSN